MPKVRLFNLSPDTKVAGMSMGGTVLAVRKNEPLCRAVFPKMARPLVSSRAQNDYRELALLRKTTKPVTDQQQAAPLGLGFLKCFASQSNVQYSLGSDWCAVPNSR